jgi:hypothetical protein
MTPFLKKVCIFTLILLRHALYSMYFIVDVFMLNCKKEKCYKEMGNNGRVA